MRANKILPLPLALCLVVMVVAMVQMCVGAVAAQDEPSLEDVLNSMSSPPPAGNKPNRPRQMSDGEEPNPMKGMQVMLKQIMSSNILNSMMDSDGP